MSDKSAQQALAFWNQGAWLGSVLSPLGWLFAKISQLRRYLYHKGVLKSQRLPVPVIIVGNITVGGTGKTPLVIYLANFLKQSGFKPGIISRGYGGKASTWPQWVNNISTATQVGDEAVLIQKQTNCPMLVGPKRVQSAKLLLASTDCNVIISDDGLQHYALARTLEIAVIDGARGFGNGYCLPAGPLREPISRLQHVDLQVINGGVNTSNKTFTMQLIGSVAVNLKTGEQKSLTDFIGIDCHALAGIGNPERFFTSLQITGLSCQTHAFPDHYAFNLADINFLDDKPVLMTEKDAVKCSSFATHRHWYIPVNAVLNTAFNEQLLHLLKLKSC